MKTKLYSQLFKIDSKGKLRVWYAVQNCDFYSVVSGIYNGRLVSSEPRIATPTNVGRSNERNGWQQAEFEIEAMYKAQRDDGYHDDMNHVLSGANTLKFLKPMLCSKFDPDDIDDILKKHGQIFSQPKLDGVRCIARQSGLWSRGGKPIVGCKHIENVLKPVFEKAPDMILDGELYNHDFKEDFNELISMIKNEGGQDKSEKYVEYHVYDSPSMSGGFEDRLGMLEVIEKRNYPAVRAVKTQEIISSEALDVMFEDYLLNGYEGQIIRLPGKSYEEAKRSKHIFKRKPLYEGGGNEEEFVIEDICEGKGNWSGAAKAIWFTNKKGDKFKATLKGTKEAGVKVYDERHKYVGKKATVVYQNLTPAGIPRFGVVKELDRWDI